MALATIRLFRLISWDVIGSRIRTRLTGAPVIFVTCMDCLGFWIGLAVYLSWFVWPAATLYVAFPFALSMAVGFLGRALASRCS